MSDARLPGNSHRLIEIGRTGTGKTQAGTWHLSVKNLRRDPWLVWNTKGDELLNEIAKMPGSNEIKFSDKITKPGLYFIRPKPHEMKSEECEQFLWNIHKRGHTGMMFDEGYMMDKYSKALNAIYTQGRSLKIPTITCTQRPAWLSPFALSEADFFQVFHLNRKGDQKTVEDYVPADLTRRLPDFHSLWYDVGTNTVSEFSPVPARERILENFEAQMRFNKRAI